VIHGTIRGLYSQTRHLLATDEPPPQHPRRSKTPSARPRPQPARAGPKHVSRPASPPECSQSACLRLSNTTPEKRCGGSRRWSRGRAAQVGRFRASVLLWIPYITAYLCQVGGKIIMYPRVCCQKFHYRPKCSSGAKGSCIQCILRTAAFLLGWGTMCFEAPRELDRVGGLCAE
jgi:hypothetical protein